MMKRVSMWKTIAAAFLIFAVQPVVAGSIQCGQSYIQDSERRPSGKYEVLKKCGEPTHKQGNVWIYERGGSKREVIFDDSGGVSSIR